MIRGFKTLADLPVNLSTWSTCLLIPPAFLYPALAAQERELLKVRHTKNRVSLKKRRKNLGKRPLSP